MSAINTLLKRQHNPYYPFTEFITQSYPESFTETDEPEALCEFKSRDERKTGLRREKNINDAFKLGQHDRLNGMDYNNIFEDYERRNAYKNGFSRIKEY